MVFLISLLKSSRWHKHQYIVGKLYFGRDRLFMFVVQVEKDSMTLCGQSRLNTPHRILVIVVRGQKYAWHRYLPERKPLKSLRVTFYKKFDSCARMAEMAVTRL